MKIAVVCSSRQHPVYLPLQAWCARHDATLVEEAAELESGDFLFLVSCGERIGPEVLSRFRHSLVLHASDLPRGRGWSPHVWDILSGADHLTLSLLTAAEPVDSGDIWHQVEIPLDGTELFHEVNAKLFAAEFRLMDWALANCDRTTPQAQRGSVSHWRRRTPDDSRIRPEQTIAEVFDLLRVCDPTRFPAFVEHRGARYALRLERLSCDADHEELDLVRVNRTPGSILLVDSNRARAG